MKVNRMKMFSSLYYWARSARSADWERTAGLRPAETLGNQSVTDCSKTHWCAKLLRVADPRSIPAALQDAAALIQIPIIFIVSQKPQPPSCPFPNVQ